MKHHWKSFIGLLVSAICASGFDGADTPGYILLLGFGTIFGLVVILVDVLNSRDNDDEF